MYGSGPSALPSAIDVRHGEAMTDAERLLELEESAEGVDLFRPPGEQLQVDKARDQAEASGWIPDPAAIDRRRPSLARARARRDDLHEAMVQLETSVAGPAQSEGWTEAVHASLLTLRGALDAHIREVGAADGLLAEIAEMAPRLLPDIERIHTEHVELLRVWDRAREALEAEGVREPEVRRRVTWLLGRLAIHRQRGSSLVYDAYNVDIGTAD
jgi:hypothetical protein